MAELLPRAGFPLRTVTIDDLPDYSPWPERLLGLKDMETVDRTPEYVRGEYDKKYAELRDRLHYYSPGARLALARHVEYDEDREVVSIERGHLEVGSLLRAMERSEDALADWIMKFALEDWGRRLPTAIVDLGCGWGRLIWRLRAELGPQMVLLGGDASPVAIELAEELFSWDDYTDFSECDLLADETYRPLELAPVGCVVVMSYTLHQLPSALPVVKKLQQYREKIKYVVTLEPDATEYGPGLLGLLQARYQQVNGYSADLKEVLNGWQAQRSAPSPNCLLPASLLRWRIP